MNPINSQVFVKDLKWQDHFLQHAWRTSSHTNCLGGKRQNFNCAFGLICDTIDEHLLTWVVLMWMDKNFLFDWTFATICMWKITINLIHSQSFFEFIPKKKNQREIFKKIQRGMSNRLGKKCFTKTPNFPLSVPTICPVTNWKKMQWTKPKIPKDGDTQNGLTLTCSAFFQGCTN